MSKLKKALEKAKAAREKEQGSVIQQETLADKKLIDARGRDEVLGQEIPVKEKEHDTIIQEEEKKPQPPIHPVEPAEKKEMLRKEINPDYSQSRKTSIDPTFLKKNKLMSLFHEEEISDQIKILTTQILNKMEEIGGNTLLITSAVPQEGKTFTAINLAMSICLKVDRTVLLVDADLRQPSVHRYLGLDTVEGLSDYLLFQAEIPSLLLNPGIGKLIILPGGRALPNSTEVLGSPRMETMVREMKERYPERFIIFDSSALLALADPLVFSRYIDGFLLVVEAEKTSTKDVERALELLKEKTVVGILLNKAK